MECRSLGYCYFVIDCGLKISVSANQKSVDFLDVTFNLDTDKYQPYTKPNSEIRYIHKNSNHPPNIINQLPKAIAIRLSKISSNEEVFMTTKGQYEKALYDSGFSTKLEYIDYSDSRKNKDQRQRKRNIIWFNPPYSTNVKTHIGKIFFKLLNKHFPKSNKLYKIFNRNTVKISYSCMKNLNSIISSHNALQLKTKNDSNGLCNCRNQESCPLQGKCLTRNIIYQATVKSKGDIKTYIELSERPVKERYRNHIKDFNNSKYRNSTELTKYIWQLKENNKDFEMD